VYKIFGLDPASDALTFETFQDFIHPDDREAVNAEVKRVFRAEASHYECPCRIVQPSGDIRHVMTRGTLVRSADGTPERMLGVTLDETERKGSEIDRAQLEIRLRQAEKLEALGQLAGGVAHDFNNLLVAIRGYGELALGLLERGEDGVAGHVEGVLSAADRAAGLTKQLLAFGRRQVLNPEVLDLNDVVRETGGLLQRLIGDNVALLTTLADEPVVVMADRGQLEQVITNLAVNARDAMPGGGLVTIQVGTTVDVPRQAVLSVADEGSGIDATTAALIFEPFFTTKGDQGTGLGLATVYGIVAQSGGHLALDTAPGSGSTFSVYLPLSTEELPIPDVAPAVARAEGTERILLIDDDPAVLTIVSSMLANRGYEIIGAADGAEAIVRFETRDSPIELVISDLIMRGLDGRETTERIRAIEPLTKVLYMSGYTDDATIRSGALTVGTGFIQKPFSGDALAARVRELLDHVAA
jgi:two-component system cell cycle sensor histidine kinase/response regulator CckA